MTSRAFANVRAIRLSGGLLWQGFDELWAGLLYSDRGLAYQEWIDHRGRR